MNWRWNFLEKLRFDYEGELLNKRGRGSFYEDVCVEYLIKNGYDTIYTDSNLKNIKCEDKGISVELVETVADNNIAYVYFKVDYGKWKKTVHAGCGGTLLAVREGDRALR